MAGKFSISRVLRAAGRYFLTSIGLAVAFYCIISLFYNTGQEQALAAEYEALSAKYGEDLRRLEIVSAVTESNVIRDREIYRMVFHSSLPDNLLSSDSYSAESAQVASMTEPAINEAACLSALTAASLASGVQSDIDSIFSLLEAMGRAAATSIPAALPLEDVTLGQTGASVGEKVTPFYKIKLPHNGLDLMAPVGTPVKATASGTVTYVGTASHRYGKTVEILHEGGYRTVYSHLSSVSVHRGQKVGRGTVIARVGTSGKSFSPHLHYEVHRCDQVEDPVHYFFLNVGSASYNDMAILALTTGQTLD